MVSLSSGISRFRDSTALNFSIGIPRAWGSRASNDGEHLTVVLGRPKRVLPHLFFFSTRKEPKSLGGFEDLLETYFFRCGSAQII